jgi:hypothetical protein
MPETTVAQLAASHRISRRTVIDWIQKGHVQARRKGFGRTSPWIMTHIDGHPVNPPRPVQASPTLHRAEGQPQVTQGTASTDDTERIYFMGQRYTPTEYELLKSQAQAEPHYAPSKTSKWASKTLICDTLAVTVD